MATVIAKQYKVVTNPRSYDIEKELNRLGLLGFVLKAAGNTQGTYWALMEIQVEREAAEPEYVQMQGTGNLDLEPHIG